MKAIHILRLTAAALILASTAACSSHRNAGDAQSSRPGKVAAMPVSEVAALADTYKPWTSLYAPFSMRLSKPVSFSFSGRATMERDKAILLSLRLLGMEVGSVYIDNDSAFVADKFRRYLVAVPFSAVSARTQLTLPDLQSLLLGRAFFPGSGTIDSGKGAAQQFSPARNGELTILTPRRMPEGATWYFTIDASPALTKLTVEPDGMDEFTVTFSDIVESIAGSVASDIRAQGTFKGKQLDASIEWNMGKAQWNGNRSCDKPDYSGYRRLTIAELLGALKKF